MTSYPNPHLLKPSEAAALLGISRSKLIDLVNQGKLEHIVIDENVNRLIRFDPSDIEAFIRQHKKLKTQ